MADDADLWYPIHWKAILVVLAAAGFALAGCNANQAPGVVAGPDFPNYNAYDPTRYAQTSGFYAGR